MYTLKQMPIHMFTATLLSPKCVAKLLAGLEKTQLAGWLPESLNFWVGLRICISFRPLGNDTHGAVTQL